MDCFYFPNRNVNIFIWPYNSAVHDGVALSDNVTGSIRIKFSAPITLCYLPIQFENDHAVLKLNYFKNN